jgi:hypothetical protein
MTMGYRFSTLGIIGKINAATVEALADPEVRSRFADLGLEIVPREQQTPEALAAMQKADIENGGRSSRNWGSSRSERRRQVWVTLSRRVSRPWRRNLLRLRTRERRCDHRRFGRARLGDGCSPETGRHGRRRWRLHRANKRHHCQVQTR